MRGSSDTYGSGQGLGDKIAHFSKASRLRRPAHKDMRDSAHSQSIGIDLGLRAIIECNKRDQTMALIMQGNTELFGITAIATTLAKGIPA